MPQEVTTDFICKKATLRGRLFLLPSPIPAHRLIGIILALTLFSLSPLASVQAENQSPYGGSPSSYGESHKVRDVEAARRLLKDYFSKKTVIIGTIVEKDLYFEADILDHDKKLIDRVVVDKRTGRIRSIY